MPASLSWQGGPLPAQTSPWCLHGAMMHGTPTRNPLDTSSWAERVMFKFGTLGWSKHLLRLHVYCLHSSWPIHPVFWIVVLAFSYNQILSSVYLPALVPPKREHLKGLRLIWLRGGSLMVSSVHLYLAVFCFCTCLRLVEKRTLSTLSSLLTHWVPDGLTWCYQVPPLNTGKEWA